MKMNKKILITGALGFIGSCLVKHLNNLGYKNLFLVDDLTKENQSNIENKHFLKIIPKEKIWNFLKNRKDIDSIVHLGACSDTLQKDFGYLMRNNYFYSVNLAKYALVNKIHFIYASSAATYGMGEFGFSESEIENLKPVNLYAFSKYLFDLWIKRNNLLDKVVGLKYFNVFGPNEYHKNHMASMVLKMMKRAYLKKAIFLFKSTCSKYKDGEQKRDFIYVKDVVKMTALFLFNKKITGIFNIGTGEATSWNTLAKALFKALNKEPLLQYIDMPDQMKRQYQNYTCADMRKFKKVFSFFKTQKIETSVEDYVKNYLVLDKRW